jgi:hypothetical protein
MSNNFDLDTLQPRDKEALRIIVEIMEIDPLHQPPTHRKLLELLNQVLPRQPNGKLALISKEQTFRIAQKLRKAELLVNAPGREYNLVPTAKGTNPEDGTKD